MLKPIRVSDPDGSPRSEPQLRGLNESDRDPETVPKRRRRVFSATDKLRIVKEADRCLASGERGALGAMLRKEGIYSSLVSSWPTQLGVHGAAGHLAPAELVVELGHVTVPSATTSTAEQSDAS